MIIPNGTIQFVRMSRDSQGNGTPSVQLDADGFPIAIQETLDDPIPCQYVPVTYDLKAKSNGESMTRQGYNIYIENDCCPSHYRVSEMAERVLMKDFYGEVIGEFSVRQFEHLVAVGQTRIAV